MLRRRLPSGRCTFLLAALALGPASAAHGQQRDTTTGYPIHNAAVIANCAGCHARDSAGMMSRLSWMRKSPEGWEASIRRMVTIHNVRVEPAAAREIVKYLSDRHGLAPEELRPARFEVERRMIDYRYTADTRTETTCRACHSMGRVLAQRRTREEWELLLATHRALYPLADFQGFRRGGPPPADSAPPPHPMDQAVAHLSRTFPLRTPLWTAWAATMRAPRIEGQWLLSGTEPGRGAFYGRITIAPVPGAEDEITTRASYRYVSGGSPVTREGRALVYTGYQWRGRSSEGRGGNDDPWREVLFIEPGWQEISGRWFKGGYDEIGIDVSLQRIGAGTMLAGIAPRALRTGAVQDVTIFGANLPRSVPTSAIDFGPGVRVERVLRASVDSITVRVRVDSAAPIGARDLYASGSALRDAAVVYDRVNRIRVTPQAGMARVGGIQFPKQLQQFAVVGMSDGADGRPDTADDLELGPVPVTWSLEEYGVTYDDDDLKFVGAIDQRGLFTPAVDGPNPQRSGERNNIGDVWVVATWQPPGGGPPLKARALLVVTVPLYMRWEPWRTAP